VAVHYITRHKVATEFLTDASVLPTAADWRCICYIGFGRSLNTGCMPAVLLRGAYMKKKNLDKKTWYLTVLNGIPLVVVTQLYFEI
jgi:hypothetical protein